MKKFPPEVDMQKFKPMFPHTIDSTLLAAFRACPQKFFLSYVEHWKGVAKSVHLVAGGAFASAIEAAREAYYVEGKSDSDAEAIGMTALIKSYGDFDCPPESAKSLERMLGAFEFYLFNYPLGGDGAEPITLPSGRKGIEFSFAEPLSIAHPVTGNPILYTGRSDMVANRHGTGVWNYDEKTTSSLGATWSRQWEMRSQFTGYNWALLQQGIKPQGTIVRGVSILKTKYDTLEVPTYRSQHEIDLWEKQTLRDIRRMIQCWEEGYWDYDLDGACTEYGGCGFQRICKSSNPDEWLPAHFVQRVWDPLERAEISVADYEKKWGFTRPEGVPPAPKLPGVFAGDSQALGDELRGLLG
jgi:hypothetical protein